MIVWLSLQWVVRHAVDEDHLAIYLPVDEMADVIIRTGHGLLNTLAGVVRLRVVDDQPQTVRLLIQDDGEFTDRVEADVIRLAALPEHLQRATY